MNDQWSVDEILFLTELYLMSGLSSSEIYPIFLQKYKRTETSIKIKIKRLKLKHTKEQTQKIKQRLLGGENNPMFGKISPNKGLNKNNSDRIKRSSSKMSETRKQMYIDGSLSSKSGENNPMFGKIPWNFGLNIYNDERLLKYGRSISDKKKNEWVNKTDTDKQIIIDRLNKAMIQNRKPTKIEVKISDYLKSLNIIFKQNKSINGFLVDFYLIDFNFVIECDGDYWHGNPKFYKNKILNNIQLKNINRDERKNDMLNNNNIKFLRFWEHDIHKNFDTVKKTINHHLNYE